MDFKNFIFCAIDFSDLEQSKRLISKIQKYIGGIKTRALKDAWRLDAPAQH